MKGKTKGEMLLGCDTAMELGVLKFVNSIDKEDKKLRPVLADIVSEYDCLFHGIGKHKHAKVKIRVDESVTPVAPPHPPSAEEPRYPRRERRKPARFKDYVCG